MTFYSSVRMIPCSSRVKCHAWDVPCMFHGILHVKVHVHTLRETWSTQTRDVNLEYLCRVSLRVHACKSEVINERYCSYIGYFSIILLCPLLSYVATCHVGKLEQHQNLNILPTYVATKNQLEIKKVWKQVKVGTQ